MKKAVIFPYDISNYYFAMYAEKVAGIKITSAVSLPGWGYVNYDMGYRVGIETGILVTENLCEELVGKDVLILVDSVIELDKTVIDNAKRLAHENDVEVIDLRVSMQNENEIFFISPEERIYHIAVPVVLIVGSGNRTAKFDTQLAVREVFINAGYKVSQIGSKNHCEFWGMHSYPNYMYLPKVSERQKVLAFNNYIYKLSIEEDPDVIIIGVPGGLAAYDNKHTLDFGIQNFYVSSALKADYVILNISYVDYMKEFIDSSVEAAGRKFEYNIDAVVLSNFYINGDATKEQKDIIFTTLNQNFVKSEADKLGIYSIWDEKDRRLLGKKVIEELEEYANMNTI